MTRPSIRRGQGCYEIYGFEEAAMMTQTTVQTLGQARLADMHDQARGDAQVRATRLARRARRQRSQAGAPGARVPWRGRSASRPGRVIRGG